MKIKWIIFALGLSVMLAPAFCIAGVNEELYSAAGDYDNNIQRVKELISQGADVNYATPTGGTTPLMEAATEDNLEIAKILIDNGANVNAKKSDGWTALMKAVGMGNIEIVKLLIDKGADVNVSGFNGEETLTALLIAESKGYSNIAQLLRQAGAK